MSGASATHQPFSFPARDGYALRGTISAPATEVGDESPPPAEPEEPAPDEAAPPEAPVPSHPFLRPPDQGVDRRGWQRDWQRENTATLPFARSAPPAPTTHWRTADGAEPEGSRGVIIVSGAIGVPHSFYRTFAGALAERGFTVISYDYRGIGKSRPRDLKTLETSLSDWVLLDMAGVIDWVDVNLPTDRLFLVGHRFGGQVPGLLDNASGVRAMATVASQSGYWKAQGGRSRWATGLHMGVSIPVLSRMSGYMPWSSLRGGEDLPKGVALQWAKWANDPRYLLGDTSIPRERIKYFSAPVLAHTFTDEPPADPTAVDPVLDAYPNVTRLVIDPKEIGIEGTGHVGFFSEPAGPLWDDLVGWFDMRAGADQDA